MQNAGYESSHLLVDLTREQAVETLADQAWSWRDGVDIWINNAGADVLTGDAAEWSFERKLRRLWSVDVVATLRLSRIIGQRMRQRHPLAGSSVILNMGWDQAQIGMAGDSGEMFAAVKGAVMAFTKSLAKSLAPEVRVNCLAPGWIKTTWGETASDYWQQRACQESLLGRWGTPDDVARAAHFLVSPTSEFISGSVLPINGGFRG
jgi:3-oxoacyl-[acyl-carrier protein] reductase